MTIVVASPERVQHLKKDTPTQSYRSSTFNSRNYWEFAIYFFNSSPTALLLFIRHRLRALYPEVSRCIRSFRVRCYCLCRIRGIVHDRWGFTSLLDIPLCVLCQTQPPFILTTLRFIALSIHQAVATRALLFSVGDMWVFRASNSNMVKICPRLYELTELIERSYRSSIDNRYFLINRHL